MRTIATATLLVLLGCQTEPGANAAETELTAPPDPVLSPGAGGGVGTAIATEMPQGGQSSTTPRPPASSSVPMGTNPTPGTSTPTPPSATSEPSGSGGTGPGGWAGAPPGGASGSPPDAGAPSGGSGGAADAGHGGAAQDPGAAHFADWPAGAAPDEVGKKLAALLAGQPSDGSKHYKEACAWYGALQVAGLIGDEPLLDALSARYQPYLDSHAELVAGPGHVDENVWGIVPLEIHHHVEEQRYLQEGLVYADHQVANIATQVRYAIDDMFMITGLQVQAYRATSEAHYLDLAAATMVRYLDRLQQPDGTFFHHEDVFIKWGRGNGWVASGLTELLRELPDSHPDYARVREGYEAMMDGLLPYQIREGQGAGLWQQVLDYEGSDNWPETSGSAMFAYAMITGVKLGVLPAERFGPVARQAWLGLVGQLESDGRLRGVSDWMWDGTVADYVARARVTGDNHGQAPMLWAAAALLR